MISSIFIEDELAKTNEFKNICTIDNPIDALRKIDYLAKKYARHNNLGLEYALSISDILSIKYILYKEEKSQSEHFFEELCIKVYRSLNSDVLKSWIIRHCTDFRYIGLDTNGNSLPLADLLAVSTKNSEIMKQVIKKVICTGKSEYSIDNGQKRTDICRMCIISGELDDAFKIFDSYIYKLNPALIENKTITLNSENSFNPNVINIYKDSTDINETDTLYGILLSLRDAELKLDTKELFLERIICNEKIQVFNIACFNLIEDIVGKDYYEHFKEYILSKVESNEIAIYEVVKNEKNEYSIMFVSLETYKKRSKAKALEFIPKKCAQA